MKRALLVVAAVAVAVSSGCPPPRPAPIEPIKVGVLNPISGSLSSLGPSWENAARLAAEEVNAGGGLFDGRPLELVFRDSGTDRDIAVEAAQELVDLGVAGLIGPATSGESGAVLAAVTEQAEIPMISCCATAADLTTQQGGNNGFFFRTTPSDELQGKALAFLAKEGFDGGVVDAPACERAAFVHRNDAYGEGFKAEFTDAYVGVGENVADKIPVVRFYGTPEAEASQEEIESVGEDAAVAIEGLLQDGVDNGELCIVVISFDIDGAPLIVSLDAALQDLLSTHDEPGFAFGYHYLVGDGANSSAFAGIVGDLGPKILGTVPFHATNEAYDQFRKAFQARYEVDNEPIAFSAQNYDAVFVMALAITQAKSVVGKDIRNKLYTVSGANGGARFEGAFFGEVADAILKGDQIDYVGPSGELTFSPVGDVVGDYVLWQVDDVDGVFRVVEREPLLASEFNP